MVESMKTRDEIVERIRLKVPFSPSMLFVQGADRLLSGEPKIA